MDLFRKINTLLEIPWIQARKRLNCACSNEYHSSRGPESDFKAILVRFRSIGAYFGSTYVELGWIRAMRA